MSYEVTEEKHVSDIARFALIALGAVALTLGIIVLAAPKGTLTLVSIIFGVYFIVSGVIRIAESASLGVLGTGLRVFIGLFGLLLIVAGIYVLLNPAIAIAALGWLIGLSWVFEGFSTIVTPSEGKRWLSVLGGALTVVAGVIVVVFVPVATVVVFTIVTGIALIVVGIVTVVHGFRIRRA